MRQVRVSRLVRYPVKGCQADELAATQLRRDACVPGDRILAIANGQRPIPGCGDWAPTKTFTRLTTETDLLRLDVKYDEGAGIVHFRHPDHGQVDVRFDDETTFIAANAFLQKWVPPGPLGGPELVRARDGYQDEAGTVSLINLASVKALSAAVGADVDPLRFRGNLYLHGLNSFEEFDLVGETITIGDVALHVLHPINRCRATCVNPDDSNVDLNVPAEMVSRFGHLYCGLRARVLTSGTLRVGDRLRRTEDRPDPQPPSEGLPVEQWPRRMRIVKRRRESEDAVSLWLRDPLQHLRPAHQPGQHIRIHGTDSEGPLWRCYTISGHTSGDLRITVKRHLEPGGRMSRHLHADAVPGETLLASGPHGHVALDAARRTPLVLASAGVGITQTVALVRSALEESPERPVLVCHTARNRLELPLWEEVTQAVTQIPLGQAWLYLTCPSGDDLTSEHVRAGRPNVGALAAGIMDLRCAEAYLCGPFGFMDAARSSLVDHGMPLDAVHQEVFASPGEVGKVPTTPPNPGPFRVTFATSDYVAEWSPTDGTLLDLADAHGIAAPSGCRAGACHICQRTLISGEAAYTLPPALPPNSGSVLLCCAVPASDIAIPL